MSVDVEVQNANGANGHVVNGNAVNEETNGTSEAQARFATGLILPPPDIKSIIDRTASYVARSATPLLFEDKVREAQRSDPKFSFLNPADPYHAYYRHKMTKIEQGEEDEVAAPVVKEEVSIKDETPKSGIIALEPPPADFILDLPPISALDLDIIKLTALFTARRGRSFLTNLAAREARNIEFEFLRPTSSLFGYFNSLVEQYSKVLLPSKETITRLARDSEEGARWKILEVSRQHAEWEKIKKEKEKKRQDDKEAEKIAFAEIDWHDYAIVQTIEFTVADANSELPPPMTVDEMISRTLAQKKMAAMIMEDTADEVEAVKARQAAEEIANSNAKTNVNGAPDGDGMMDVSDDEAYESKERIKKEEEDRQLEMERARAIQATSMDASGPMKIRTDYVPKLGGRGTKVTMTTCAVCGQQVPVDELQEHMRIELLDPRWKSQRDVLEARRAQLNELQRGANVETSLRSLARARVDIFGTEADEEKRKREEQAEQERRKEREKDVWDGHTASKDKTLDKFQSSSNIDEQIAAIHRAKGLAAVESTNGPGIGPAAGPGVVHSLPAPPPSLPAPPRRDTPGGVPDPAFAAATVSAGPQPASMYSGQTAPVMLPPLHYQGLDAAQPFGFQPPQAAVGGPGMHPQRLAALSGTPPIPMQAGMIRPADQMEGIETDGIPPAKKQKVGRLPGGQYYPEQNWIDLHPHPISVQVQLPVDSSKPEWKLDGSVVTLNEVPVTLLVSTLRDHVVRHINSTVPLSRIMLSLNGKLLTNANTLASYNIEDEDLLVLSLREAKKKK